MRSFAILAAGIALASAQSITTTSVPTGPPMGVYKTAVSVPALTATTVIPTSTATIVARRKRDTAAATTCLAQPTGISYTTTPDTDVAFSADTFYSAAALAAGTPFGFSSVFLNTQVSPNADAYMGFTLMSSYDVQACSAQCSAISGCNSFNIYYERDPTVDPNDASCLNPSSVVQIKCVWWGSFISTAVNVNAGQWRGNFHVVIAGSNGYTKNGVSSSSSSTSTVSTTSTMSTTSTTSVASSTTTRAVVSSTTTPVVSSTTVATSTTLAVVVKVASTTSTTTTSSTVSSTTSAAATSTPFYIQINWTGTNADNTYLSVNSRGAVSYVSSKRSATIFKIDAAGDLINTATGTAANLSTGSGKWERLAFTSLGQNTNYASCSLTSPYVMCNVNNAFQFAGLCNNDGNVYFGVPSKIPSGCAWAGLFPISA